VGLGTSGSGDVLAGLVAGLVARGATPAQALVWGVWVHGEAGRRLSQRIGAVGFLARELLPEIPVILQSLLPRKARR
jgi:NAD(P)H-hydrate repair Nnr-like enzyme with NAD(P)H-hydrate dehydratase domain